MRIQTLLFWSVLLLVLPGTRASAQALQVTSAQTPPFTPQNLISNVFLGDGVEVTNITYNGDPVAVGYFTGGQTVIGIERGIVMTTGIAESSGASNGSNGIGSSFASVSNTGLTNDADLASQTTSNLNNAAVYVITFIPTADTLRFRYVFGSEEYPEYGCSSFNDVFGFFIQGPGYPTPTNIAKIPGTNLPVTINNIHPQNPVNPACTPLNEQYYNNNNAQPTQPVYDGYTDVFIAEAIVVPCQEYTIKLAIADVSDQAFDSGVFLEAKSFGTGSLDIQVATVSLDGTITEGCSQGTLTFRLPSPATEPFTIDYNIWGTATNGVDYQTIPPDLTIPIGGQEVVIPIVAFEDNLPDNGEFLAIDVQRDPCNRDTVYVFFRDNALIAPNLRPDTTLCTGAPPLELNGTLPIPLPDPPTFTNDADVNITPTNVPVTSSINVFGVQPVDLGPGVLRSVCFNIQHPWDDDLDILLLSPGGQFVELSTDNGGNADNYTNTCFTQTAGTVISSPGPFAPPSAAPFTGDWLPEGVWSDLWDGTHPTNGTWKLQVRDDANGFTGKLLDWTITFEPSYKIEYQWTPLAGLSCPTCPITMANPTQTTTYIVRATDSYGCEVFDSVTIDVRQALPAPVVSCGTTNSSSIGFTWTSVPGATAYEVNIDGSGWVPANGTLAHTVNGLSANSSVTIEVRGINPTLQCESLVGTTTCVNCDAPVIQSQAANASCAGQPNGTVTITTDNVNPPYVFELGVQNNTTGQFTGLAAGTYTVTVTDNSGCSSTVSATVDQPAAMTLSTAIQQPVSCFGVNDALVTATAAGGTGPYTYLWNDAAAQTTPAASNLAAGAYGVTATDAQGCTATGSVTLTEPADLTVTLPQAVNPGCFGASTGSINALAAGGTGPYQFAWNNAATGAINGAIPAGTYTVTVTDNNGCTETATASLTEPTQLTASTTGSMVNCFGGADGTATVTAQGGTTPYQYVWSDPVGQTTPTATGLISSNFQVTVTDNAGCSVVQSVNIASPLALGLTATATDALCNGGTEGSAMANATGGVGGFSYQWSDPAQQTTATALGLGAGVYTVTATDQNGCTVTATTTVTQPAAMTLSSASTDVSCSGAQDGAIAVTVQGGTGPYTYGWNSGQSTPNITGVPAGAYSVTVTDNNGCSAVQQDQINPAVALTTSFTTEAVKCFGNPTGAIALTVSGGASPYTVNWNGPNGATFTGTNLTTLSPGAYQATVTDQNGCTVAIPVTVDGPAAALALDLPAIGDTICYGASNGAATVVVTGGTPPYAYQWSSGNNPTTPTVTGLPVSIVGVTVTDANNCIGRDSIFIPEKGQALAVAEKEDPSCHDGTNGKAAITAMFYAANPANPGSFSYVWSTNPVQTGPQAFGLLAGQTYSVTATDADGCTAVQTVTLGNPLPVLARVDSSANIACHGDATGWALAQAVGGVEPYTYSWAPNVPNPTDAQATDLRAGTYRVTVTDQNGCTATSTVTLTQPTPLTSTLQPTAAKCFGEATGSVRVLPGGGVTPYTFLWSNGAQGTEVSDLPAGVIVLTLQDANGCLLVDSTNIGQPSAPVSGTAAKSDVTCFGGRDGRITIQGTGGTPPYRYAVNNEPWNGSTVQIGLTAGIYTPRIIDRNGCEVSLDTVQVDQRSQLEVDLGPDISILLGRDTQLFAEVFNAAGDVTYSWDAPGTRWLSCDDCPDPLVDSLLYLQDFRVRVVDSLGCTAMDDIRVKVEKPRRIFVPTGFTPNGDFNNDLLLVHGQRARILSFQVYDRWGELVYQAREFDTNDTATGWDGRFRDKDMDPGTYVWVLEVQYIDGEKEVLKGNTTLIR